MVLNNRFEFIGNDDGVDLDDFTFFGPGGTGSATFQHNRFTSISDDCINVESFDFRSEDAGADGSTTILIEDNWFILQIPSLLVSPGESLEPSLEEKIQKTIHSLGLNHLTLLDEREEWIECYYNEDKIPWSYLKREPPRGSPASAPGPAGRR